MTQFNPITGAALVGQQISVRQTDDKAAQIRRAQETARNIAARTDRFEHVVESTEEVDPAHDEDKKKDQKRGKSKPHPQAETDTPDDQDRPKLDLTA
jgi:broad specificity phosphatase PhoE